MMDNVACQCFWALQYFQLQKQLKHSYWLDFIWLHVWSKQDQGVFRIHMHKVCLDFVGQNGDQDGQAYG